MTGVQVWGDPGALSLHGGGQRVSIEPGYQRRVSQCSPWRSGAGSARSAGLSRVTAFPTQQRPTSDRPPLHTHTTHTPTHSHTSHANPQHPHKQKQHSSAGVAVRVTRPSGRPSQSAATQSASFPAQTCQPSCSRASEEEEASPRATQSYPQPPADQKRAFRLQSALSGKFVVGRALAAAAGTRASPSGHQGRCRLRAARG